MPKLSQIHSCSNFAFLLDEKIVTISRGEYYADFAHWCKRSDGLQEVDYSINQALQFCPFCGGKLEKLPTMADYLKDDKRDDE
jgi:hypothetical protein